MNYKIKKIFSIILATAIMFSFANGLTVKTSYAEESIEGKIFYIKSALKNDLVLDIRGGVVRHPDRMSRFIKRTVLTLRNSLLNLPEDFIL